MIISVGTSYTGFEKWIVACDLRYFDYANTMGFRHAGFSPDGAAQGLNWNSIMSVAVGVQRQINEKWSARMGYCFNENPIDSAAASYNVASPLIIQHVLSMGASYTFADNWFASLTYMHCFQNSVTGPIINTSGQIPNSSVTCTDSADAVTANVTKRF
jgi:long-chain fatty acid transport protein